MVKQRTKFKKVLSENLRYGTVKQRASLLKWVNQPKFKGRKPTPAELTTECLEKSSPLYGIMKTKQKEAAESYWRLTAQDILRHIDVVEVDVETEEVIKGPAIAYVHTERGQYGRIADKGYIPTERLANDPSLKTAKMNVLDRMHKEFQDWFNRWENYSEFMGEFSDVIKAYRRLRKRHEKKSV